MHLFEQAFITEVHKKMSEIDPSKEQDWYSLTLGWALGKGLTPINAHDFAIYIRYHTQYG